MSDLKQKIPANKTTVKVSPDLLLEISNEQNRLLNTGHGKVSQGDIVHRAWRAYKDQSIESTISSGRLSTDRGDSDKSPKTVLKSYSFLPELADTLSLRESQWLEDLLRLGLEHLRRAPGRESEQGNPAATTADINELLTVAERQMDQAEGSASQANDAAKELRRVGDTDKSDRRGTRKRIK